MPHSDDPSGRNAPPRRPGGADGEAAPAAGLSDRVEDGLIDVPGRRPRTDASAAIFAARPPIGPVTLHGELLTRLGIAAVAEGGDGRGLRMNAAARRLAQPPTAVSQSPGGLERWFPFTALDAVAADPLGPLTSGRDGAEGGPPRAGHRWVRRFRGVTDGGAEVLLHQDVTEQHLDHLRLLHLSRHDPLTGLLDRRHFILHLEELIDPFQGPRRGGALVLVDIDRFRLVNDTVGVDAGDALLEWVGSRIREALRVRDVAARFGDDEFILWLDDVSLEQAARFATTLFKQLTEFKFAWQSTAFSVRLSVGVASLPAEVDNVSDALGAAAAAVARARARGGNCVHVLQSEEEVPDATRRAAVAWVARIVQHLRDGKLRLYAQPIVDLTDRDRPPSVEVLFRMVDDNGRVHGPSDIIRAAERVGLMDDIDRWIIRHTLRALQRHQLLDHLDHVSINLSATSLRQEKLLSYIHQQFEEFHVAPSRICFEITETAAVANLDEVKWLIQELGSIGCRLSLDDFGSGMASYAYLRDLAVDYVKIDKVFVQGVLRSELESSIVSSIHHIARLAGAETVAEGVEDMDVARAVRELGIQHGQGWLFGKPRPLDERCLDELRGVESTR